jgi:hypothetical protein
MLKSVVKAGLMISIISLAHVGSANADVFSLTNSNGGDGYSVGSWPTVAVYGADNGVGSNTTNYTAIASKNETINLKYQYTTYDCCGSYWDPAGSVVNGVYTQLSPFSSAPGYQSPWAKLSFNVNAGDTYGVYVYSVDSILGRGEIAVGAPEISTWVMLLAGFASLGLAGYRRNRKQRQVIDA